MAKLQDIKTPLLQFEESDAPATPASGVVKIYAKADGLLYSKDDAGVETCLGSVTVANNLTETVTGKALDATQGKVLADLVSSKAVKVAYTATLPSASWTGSASPYSKAVTVTGILSTDSPLIDIVPSGTYATDVTMETNWVQIYRMVTSADTITFYAHAVPTADIPLQILVVR